MSAVASHASAELGLGVGEPPLAVQHAFLVAGEPVLVAGEHGLEGEVRGCGPQPRRVGGGMRLDVRHAPVGEDVNQLGTHQRVGLVFGAAVLGPEPFIGINDFRFQQPVE